MAIKKTKLEDKAVKEPVINQSTEEQAEPTKSEGLSLEAQKAFDKQKKELDELKDLVAKISTNHNQVQASSDTGAIIETVIREMNKKSDEEKYGERGEKYVEEADQDINDVLKEGVSFFAHQGGYVIVDDLKNKRRVATPFREAIIFDHFKTKVIGAGKNLTVENMCRYTSYSKKEVAWLRNSNYYGWKIFDDSKAVTSTHAKLATHISRFLMGARAMDKHQMFKACESMGIAMSTDIENMRLQYAQILAEKEIEKEGLSSVATAKANAIEKALMEGQNLNV